MLYEYIDAGNHRVQMEQVQEDWPNAIPTVLEYINEVIMEAADSSDFERIDCLDWILSSGSDYITEIHEIITNARQHYSNTAVN